MQERFDNLNQIRDILFGSQLQGYDSRLDKIESHIYVLEQEMRDHLEQVKTTCTIELRETFDSLHKEIKSLNLKYQSENSDLRQFIEQVNQTFSSRIDTLDKTVDRQSHSIRIELATTREKLQENTHNLKAQVFAELEKQMAKLAGSKVSKDDMAEYLIELGLKLKGNEVFSEVKADNATVRMTEARLLESGHSLE